MTDSSLSEKPFDELMTKAFIIALVRSEQKLPPDLILEINQVGESLSKGETENLSNLLEIAKKDKNFYAVFKTAYQELQELDESVEKNKFLNEMMQDPTPRRPDDFDNFLAPPLPLISKDPQSEAKKLLGGVADLVQKIYNLNF